MNNIYGYVAEQNEENQGWYVFDGANVIGGPFDTKLAAESFADAQAKKRQREEAYDSSDLGL